jgi:hypothetical protein
MSAMQEFLLWGNCTNKCDFCWQCQRRDETIFLNKEEMILSIKETINKLDSINDGDDVLLVGGEILASYYPEVDVFIQGLLYKCVNMIKNNKIRFLYINTNLIYKDKKNLIYLFEAIRGYEDRLKFTTSYDIYGRFQTEEAEKLFLENLEFIRDFYSKINVVVNCIITKQLVESNFNEEDFKEKYKVKYVNFIPYVPIPGNNTMNVEFKDIIKVLARAERKQRGYIDFYIKDYDYNQNKILYQYHKDRGYEECTSKYLECHHNENFKKILNGECFICKLKEVFN